MGDAPPPLGAQYQRPDDLFFRSLAKTKGVNFQVDQVALERNAALARCDEITREKERLAQILEADTSVSIITTDANGIITLFNQGACNFFGYTVEEVVGRATPLWLHPEAAIRERVAELSAELGRPVDDFEAMVLNALRYGSETRDWTCITKDGRELDVCLAVTVLRKPTGEIDGFLGIAYDITEARQADVALRESEWLLNQSGQVAGIGGWELDVNTMVPRWTHQTRVIHEVDANYEPTLAEALAFYPPEAHPIIEQAVQQAIEKGTPWDVELPFVTAKGRQIWVRVIGNPEIEDGKTIRLIGTFQNISKRKLAEQALEKERLRLANVIEGSHLGSWEWNVQTGETIFNERWAEICGYALSELQPTTVDVWRRLTHPDDSAHAEILLGQHFRGELPFYKIAFRMRHKAGHWVWVQAIGNLISRTDDGQPLMMYGTHADISREKQKEEELLETNLKLQAETARAEAASRAKGEFLANMSHEIRTPLNAIIGLSEMLENDPTGPDAREYLQTIRHSGDSLLALINDILDFSKIEAGQLSLERVPLDLKHSAENALRTVAMQAAKRELELQFHCDPNLPDNIVGDPLRLRQILVNLLTNAIKFTEVGQVTLQIDRTPDARIRFSVADTGIGMSPAEQEKLFQSFSQVSASTTRRFGGTGLGLAISQKLVHLMDGDIKVESAPGKGSKFYFSIPLILTESPAPPRSKRPKTNAVDSNLAARHPLAILVVEDNPVNQLLVTAMLRRFGYEPALAVNGHAALEAVAGSNFDLVFMDVQMPELDGLDTTRILCESYPANVRPYIVALTANAMGGDRAICIAAGMDDYLAKPVRHEQLAAAIERAALRRAATE